jgi:Ala-tRNA(Pro) deacylase
MQYHKTTQIIQNLLKENNCWFETFEHESVKTSEEASKTRPGYSLEQGAKAMIVRVKINNTDKKFIMLVYTADQKFDNAKVKKLLNAKDVRLATEEEIFKITDGIKIGGIPPFGNLFDIPIFVDQTLFNNEKIVFNAGDRSFSIAMFSKDYVKIVKPIIENII